MGNLYADKFTVYKRQIRIGNGVKGRSQSAEWKWFCSRKNSFTKTARTAAQTTAYVKPNRRIQADWWIAGL